MSIRILTDVPWNLTRIPTKDLSSIEDVIYQFFICPCDQFLNKAYCNRFPGDSHWIIYTSVWFSKHLFILKELWGVGEGYILICWFPPQMTATAREGTGSFHKGGRGLNVGTSTTLPRPLSGN